MSLTQVFAVAIVAMLPVSAAPAPPDDFDQAVNSVGPDYEKVRRRLLAATDFGIVAQKLRSDSARERITAAILEGYRERAAEYDALRDQRLVDRHGDMRFPWSYDPRTVKPEYLPLRYEFLTKDVEGKLGHDTAIRVISFLARRGTSPDVVALLDLVGRDGLAEASRTAVARTVSALPRAMVRPEDLLKSLETEGSRNTKSRTVAHALINGLIASAADLSDEGKDAVVQRLQKIESIRTLAGAATFARAIGGIGGRNAAPVVAQFLDKSETPSQARWAISVLGSIGDDVATASLLKFAGAEKKPADLRILSIRNLSNGKYGERIGEGLVAIAKDAGRTDRERAEAVDALVKLYENQPRNGPAQREIRARVEGFELPTTASDALHKKLREAKQSLQGPRGNQ
jgi:hypothetical protein